MHYNIETILIFIHNYFEIPILGLQKKILAFYQTIIIKFLSFCIVKYMYTYIHRKRKHAEIKVNIHMIEVSIYYCGKLFEL